MDLKKIRPQDEAYWDKYRATPKAFIRLAAGQKLWRSRYGAVTSIRVSEDFREEKLRTALDPGIAGLMQIPVREQAVAASSGSTDFSEYFLYFSFFLIVSALLLAGLFFRFSLEQRSSEIATLRAVGYSSGVLRRIFLTEGFLLALAGGSLGILGSAIYAGLILTGLRTLWVDAVGTRDLTFHLTPTAMALAFGTSLLVGPIVILASLRVISKRDIRDTAAPRKNRALLYASVFTLAGLALLFSGGPGGFFGAGAALLTAALLGVFYWLRRTATGVNTVTALGIRYAAHRPGRSILCIALIASSAFLVVSVEAFRRDSHHGLPGWRYYGETALPVYYNPGSAEGREALNLGTAPAAKWLTLRLRPGDDASCLNLYAPANPRVLGVPSALLTFPPTGDDTIPAAVDANTLQYVLHSTQGAVIEVGGAKLRIMRVLTDSIFQSELLISDKDFQVAFREEGGFRAFLVDTPEVNEGALETALADYGLDLTSTAARLASFHRVENTYLSTFQALGALGLILGTIGLGTVLIRNILERQRELALLRAVGFPPSALAQMTLAESLFLMATGLAAGIACALITVIPVVSQRGGSIPVWSILGLIGAVLVTGLISTFFAARVLQRMPLLALLRSD
ncbi:MAG: ABC transporter permease [Bryobacteraceae bacterium]|nr:ABC transporter permease [Bryobacteraceae bacterium]